jgi:LytS/YehU family sensor histidine kinase
MLDICLMKKFQVMMFRLLRSRLPVHFFFCFTFIALFFLPVLSNKRPYEVIDRAITVCIFLLVTTYLGRWCCRRWLIHMRFIPFIVSITVLTIILSFLIGMYLYLLNLQKRFEALSWGIPLVILFLALGVFLTLSKEAMRRQLVDLEISDQQKQSELDLLRAQLSPHFLFNTLNNLYGISLKKPDNIPSLLIQLSDLLRYSVYTTKDKFVPLNDELAYIRNYIELERIRMADRLLLEMDIDKSISPAIKISPMVLIVFVENAFKHAKNSYEDTVSIGIRLHIDNGKIKFAVSNSCDYDEWLRQQLEKKTGIGISNTVRRLDLLYPGEYTLNYRMEKNTYFLNLELNAK